MTESKLLDMTQYETVFCLKKLFNPKLYVRTLKKKAHVLFSDHGSLILFHCGGLGAAVS